MTLNSKRDARKSDEKIYELIIEPLQSQWHITLILVQLKKNVLSMFMVPLAGYINDTC